MPFETTLTIPELTWKTSGFRAACRWVIVDENGQIPILFDSVKKYHKLPWWGIEWDETKIETFIREIREETGCEIDNIKEVWKVVEKISDWEQISYCFIWKVVSKWETHFTEKEIERGFQLKWLKIEDAISLIKNEKADTDEEKFKKERELFILEKSYLELENNWKK